MLRWNNWYSDVSADLLFVCTFCAAGSVPLAMADGGAMLGDGDVTGLPVVQTQQLTN